jgi:hypothetical protein
VAAVLLCPVVYLSDGSASNSRFADAISIQEFITADSDALLLVSELKSAFFKHSEYFSRRLAWACSCLKPSAKAPVIGAKARKLLQ